ncbi:MAG TPA: glycosyltransferase [Bacteroidetes bacterium]|nr:glycosyltransferase [Bacteroidota bacterium]
MISKDFLEILVFLYIGMGVLLLIGTFLKQKTYSLNPKAKVTVILAARDEEQNLPVFLQSLLRLSFPKDRLQVILANDRSSDRTGSIFDEMARQHDYIQAIHINKIENYMSGKENAIHKAMEIATGEFVFLTDADCILNERWIESMLLYFNDDVGVVCGQTYLAARHTRHTLWEGVQALDWAYLLTAASGATGLGKPSSCIGNNMALRRRVYFQVGGYPHIGFSVTEDFAFLRIVCKRTDWEIRFPIHPDTTVTSFPEPTLKGFFQQRKRWVVGGKSVRFFGLLLMSVSFLNHLLLPVSLFSSSTYATAAFGIILIFITDLVLLFRTLIPNRKLSLLSYFPFFEIFYFLYTTVFTFFAFSNSIHWKKDHYKGNTIRS